MKMKKIWFVLAGIICFSTAALAQEENTAPQKGFDPNRVFIGSSLNIGLSNRFFNLGLNPEVGYSFNNWLDAGVLLNINYFSQNGTVYKDKNFNYGGGGFLRIWPVNFLHLQIQPEYNWISSTRTYSDNSGTFKYKTGAASLLAGIGYGSREIGSRFSHFTIMIDLLQEMNSPYRDNYTGDPQPVFRGGFGIYLNSRRR